MDIITFLRLVKHIQPKEKAKLQKAGKNQWCGRYRTQHVEDAEALG